ncbi:MAG: PDZ domain-containing protein, partial [Deltaproteobacteria bacterium]|nr:PDZ domain-containing protein [Deltaproteobacteria bacterium]
FNLTFDYGKKTIVFEPNARYAARDVYDRAGLWMNASDDRTRFEVVDVTAGGPAAKAGLAKGDTIVAIDGTPVSGLRLPDVRWRFRSAAVGTEVKLRILRSGTERELTVTLADQV